MASIGMNQRFAGSRTFTIAELQHGHQLAVLKGVLVFLAILFVEERPDEQLGYELHRAVKSAAPTRPW
jgi:hypothetical protein